MKLYALKENESGRYRCQNVYVSDEVYHFNIANAILYSNIEEAEYQANSLNRLSSDFVRIVSFNITED